MYNIEAALKYFLIQALGSAVILLASILVISYTTQAVALIIVALFLKMGAAPLHF